MKTLWHKSEEPDLREKGWHKVTLADIDANFALEVDPDHWSIENPDDAPEVLPVAEQAEIADPSAPIPFPDRTQPDASHEGDQ
jgi:hypothetical protein